ncbi:hypothetical protein [Nonomuraea solani]|uniref:hypothetical protein n=1 Tax=Nonomuraea solani TaxID=1144553 RepID=UPI000CDE6CAA|nr:hypothetical protein [Nonomuraea solani]
MGGISGGAFNPAAAIGAATMGLFDWSMIWVWLLADLAGARWRGWPSWRSTPRSGPRWSPRPPEIRRSGTIPVVLLGR